MISILLLTTSILFLVGSLFLGLDSKNSLQSKLSTIILLIAGSSYMWMNYIYGLDNTVNLRTWRYLDWLFTVPILVYQMYLYLDPFGRTKGSLITSIACMLGMLGLGFAGEAGIISKFLGGFLGTIFAIYTFVSLSNGISKDKIKFYTSVLGLWLFYPVVYFFADSIWTIVMYALVDLSAKLGMAIYIKETNED
jgi:bacteriorhodopsin